MESYSSDFTVSEKLELPETSVIRDVSEEATPETSSKCFSPLLSYIAKIRLYVDTQDIGMASFVVFNVAEDFVTMSDIKTFCMALGHCQKWLPVTVPK